MDRRRPSHLERLLMVITKSSALFGQTGTSSDSGVGLNLTEAERIGEQMCSSV